MVATRIATGVKALTQLGPTQVGLNALYRFGLMSGHYRRVTPTPVESTIPANFNLALFPQPGPAALRDLLGAGGLRNLLSAADEIVSGRFRQFGGEPVQIKLAPPGFLAHWTDYESGRARHAGEDIKLVWEPARFGWVFTLGRAWLVSEDERYPQTFWKFFEEFQAANPPYFGPNWTSGQEVGLRLMALVWAAQIFSKSVHSTPDQQAVLSRAVVNHAARIPPTLVYARSQNNNHLLTEAAALLTAARTLPNLPQAPVWQRTGLRWLEWCWENQIEALGEYVQHSSNYHRLALQTALWVNALGGDISPAGREKLARAAEWLVARLDPGSGGVPNLGANDGALIFPLANAEIGDYRPVAAASARAFLGTQLEPGTWNEMSLWFGLSLHALPLQVRPPIAGLLASSQAWAALRAVHYTSRPSHADQLHLDLWWRGLNIALDPGTYRYNAAPPWDNRLATSLVHNTVTVNGLEQMTRVGRFLYLDWAAADFEHTSNGSLAAWTDAYRRFGVRHTRHLTALPDGRWSVRDELTRSVATSPNTYRLAWLLPDWPWEIEDKPAGTNLRLRSPHGWINLDVSADSAFTRSGLLRAGELIHGQAAVEPVYGWVSPTYNVKKPALALAVEVQSKSSLVFESIFTFPEIKTA